jgi:hypothetical protein
MLARFHVRNRGFQQFAVWVCAVIVVGARERVHCASEVIAEDALNAGLVFHCTVVNPFVGCHH